MLGGVYIGRTIYTIGTYHRRGIGKDDGILAVCGRSCHVHNGLRTTRVGVRHERIVTLRLTLGNQVHHIDGGVARRYLQYRRVGQDDRRVTLFVPAVVKALGCLEMVQTIVTAGYTLQVAAFAVDGEVGISDMNSCCTTICSQTDSQTLAHILTQADGNGLPIVVVHRTVAFVLVHMPCTRTAVAGLEVALRALVEHLTVAEDLQFEARFFTLVMIVGILQYGSIFQYQQVTHTGLYIVFVFYGRGHITRSLPIAAQAHRSYLSIGNSLQSSTRTGIRLALLVMNRMTAVLIQITIVHLTAVLLDILGGAIETLGSTGIIGCQIQIVDTTCSLDPDEFAGKYPFTMTNCIAGLTYIEVIHTLIGQTVQLAGCSLYAQIGSGGLGMVIEHQHIVRTRCIPRPRQRNSIAIVTNI